MLTREQYQQEFTTAVDKLMALMNAEWGSDISTSSAVEEALLVKVKFNLGDFPHDGKRFYINAGNYNRRSPENLARQLAREILFHRNICGRCGVGTPTLYQRLRATGRDELLRPTPADLVYPDTIERLLHPGLSVRLIRQIQALK